MAARDEGKTTRGRETVQKANAADGTRCTAAHRALAGVVWGRGSLCTGGGMVHPLGARMHAAVVVSIPGLLGGLSGTLDDICTVAVLLLVLCGCTFLALGRLTPVVLCAIGVLVIALLNPRWDPAVLASPLGTIVGHVIVLLLMLTGLRVMVAGQFHDRRRR